MLSQSNCLPEYHKNEEENQTHKLILQENSLDSSKCMEKHRFKCLLSKDVEKQHDC